VWFTISPHPTGLGAVETVFGSNPAKLGVISIADNNYVTTLTLPSGTHDLAGIACCG
jgi:hypothetical protein